MKLDWPAADPLGTPEAGIGLAARKVESAIVSDARYAPPVLTPAKPQRIAGVVLSTPNVAVGDEVPLVPKRSDSAPAASPAQ